MALSNKCMLCGCDKFVFVHELRDDNSRDAVRCKQCGHVQVMPLPTGEEDYAFYQSGKMYDRVFKNPEELRDLENTANRMRAFVEYQPRKLIPYLHADWKILEIGSAFGWLVEYLQNRGYNIDGVEISDDYRSVYKARTGKELLSFNFLTDEPETLEKNGYYDCICSFHTLEHIIDPVAFINRAAKLLKTGGMIYVDVPNFNDYMKSLCAEYERHQYARAHVAYYMPSTLAALIEKCGFVNVRIIGNQIYSPENASQWLRLREPFHDYHQIDLPEPIQWLNNIYKEKLESELKSYAIIGIGYKKS